MTHTSWEKTAPTPTRYYSGAVADYGKESECAVRSGDWKLITDETGNTERLNFTILLHQHFLKPNDLSQKNNQQMRKLAELWNEWNAENLPWVWDRKSTITKNRLEEWMENEAEYRQQESESREIYQMDVN